MYIPFGNGVYNCKTKKFEKYEKHHMITSDCHLPYNFKTKHQITDIENKEKIIKDLFNEIEPNKDKQNLILKFIAGSLFSSIKKLCNIKCHKDFDLWNGSHIKNILVEVFKELVVNESDFYDKKCFLDKKSSNKLLQDTYKIISISMIRLIICEDNILNQIDTDKCRNILTTKEIQLKKNTTNIRVNGISVITSFKTPITYYNKNTPNFNETEFKKNYIIDIEQNERPFYNEWKKIKNKKNEFNNEYNYIQYEYNYERKESNKVKNLFDDHNMKLALFWFLIEQDDFENIDETGTDI